jgi:hypothetical protein
MLLAVALSGCFKSRALVRERVVDSLEEKNATRFFVPPAQQDTALLLLGIKTNVPADWNAKITVKTKSQTISDSVKTGDLTKANYLEREGLVTYIISNVKLPLQSGLPTEIYLEFESAHQLEGASLWIAYIKQ